MNSEFICGQTPILDLAAGVRAHLAAKGYKERNLIRLQKIWNHFARYADNCHFTIELGAAFLRDAYDIEWAEFPPPMKRHQRRSVSAIRYLRDYELNGEISLHRPMKQPYIWPSQFSDAAQSFLEYMDENGYSRDYIRGTTREVHKFLEYLSDHGVQGCETITISNVMDFIRDQYSHFAVSTLKTTVGKLRTFLKFLYLDELTDCDLASMIPSVRNFRLAQLPVVWNPEDLHLLLTAINRETSNGKRDYAIFMLAIYLGLRIGDILHLQFKNIDWEKSVIQISQVKTDELLSLPMPPELGWALIDYIRDGRPETESPFIFVRHCAPFQAFCSNNNFHYQMRKYAALMGKGRKHRTVPLMTQTALLLKNYLEEQNLIGEEPLHPVFFNKQRQKLSRKGITYIIEKYVRQAAEVTPMPTFNVTPHVFRHTKAMHLLNADVNMFYIRDILGHVDISTTEIYARIDAEKKRTILEKISCNSVSNRLPSWQEDRSLMMWLKSLAK